MKTYFLALRNEDFDTSSGSWKTGSIDLYANKFYTNYSAYKSPYGNNVIGDYTFTGTSILDDSESTITGSETVTNFGEVIKDADYGEFYIYEYDDQDGQFYLYDTQSATPYRILNPVAYDALYRFVDTSSAIDIVGFKHAFSNLPGTENPTFNLKIKTNENNSATESDWRQIASVAQDVTVTYLRDVSRYVKFEITFNAESDVSSADFLLLVQIQIAEITSPVLTSHTRNILSRFPGWTKIYQDSIEKATPQLATPTSVAGTFLNALVGENLDVIDRNITKVDLDSFITTANEDQIDWIYISSPVSAGFIKVKANGVELSRVSTYDELLSYRANDYVFYYNYLTSELYTLKDYNTLYVDTQKVNQIPVQNFNAFDEFGLRVGLQRLYLESNSNFKKRILDVYVNPPTINAEGLKRTLRRELDIWRAYGATPNSNYAGATPEILEMSDLLKDPNYFDEEGNPKREFYNLVEDLNKRYPSNFGYIKWDQAYWDYAGLNQEGVTRIPQISDATPIATQNYQYGIGDFDDAKLVLEKLDKRTKEYSFGLRAHGYKYDSMIDGIYEPIKLAYDTYISYIESYYDHDYATVNYDLYLKLNSHGYIPNNTVYKASVTEKIKNIYGPNSSYAPEYITKDLFSQSGLSNSDIVFYSTDAAATPYINTIEVSATESYTINQIPIFAVNQATINHIYSKNKYGENGDYSTIRFNSGSAASYSSPTIVKTFTNPTYSDGIIRIASTIYNEEKYRITNTTKIRSEGEHTIVNYPTAGSSKSIITIKPFDIISKFALPPNVTPLYVHIDNVVGFFTKTFYDDIQSDPDFASPTYGGTSLNKDENEIYYIPSSPNVWISFIDPNFSTPQMHENYIDTVGSTVNYYFSNAKFPYSSTPNLITIKSNDGNRYPFSYPKWEEFSADSIIDFNFTISEQGIVHSSPNFNGDLLDSKNSNVINYYDLYRHQFGLEEYSASPNLYFTAVEVLNDNDDVKIWTDYTYVDEEVVKRTDDLDKNTSLNYWDGASGSYRISRLPVRAEYDYSSTKYISPSIKTGWYFQDGERFIYAKPKTELSYNNSEIVLDQVARKGSPILVSTIDTSGSTVNYEQVSFFDEATPTDFSFHNYEYITAKNANTLYLAYSNVFDVTIKDGYTGEIISSGLSSLTNKINIISIPEVQPFKIGREYRVSYRVKNTFNVNNQYYNTFDNSYRTVVNLLSTPNNSYYTYVTFESSLQDDDYELPELKLNPLYSSLDQGYIYLSHNEYIYGGYDYLLSPKQVLADNKDFMVLNIFSKDLNGNPKPYQNYSFVGENISATPSSISTNVDGYGRSQIRYTGPNVGIDVNENFIIQDLNATPGYIESSTIEYYVKPFFGDRARLTAEVDTKIVTADGVQKINIIGKTDPSSVVFWRKARDLQAVFNTEYSTFSGQPGQDTMAGLTTADYSGNFNIGSYIAQPDATPGYWFVAVETNLNSSQNIPEDTVAGDIVYWYEKYDSNQSDLDEPIIEADYYLDPMNRHYAYNPVFKVSRQTENVYYMSGSTPPWNLPSWYPVSKYTQYQTGMLGATPYVIEYSEFNPDYEEE